MKQILALAAEALKYKDFPIAAISVLDNTIIASRMASEQREKP